MENLWCANTPQNFWQSDSNISQTQWQEAAVSALRCMGSAEELEDLNNLSLYILGEAQFGEKRWTPSKFTKFYYSIKRFFPRRVRSMIRSLFETDIRRNYKLHWPVEDWYARFQWETMRQLILASSMESVRIKYFWPDVNEFAFVLTHDIETGKGQSFVPYVADMEEKLGFRSSFNFVACDYPLDRHTIEDLTKRGFEVGIHGLKHDPNLFKSEEVFQKNAIRINCILEELGAVGFRAPYTIRQLEWMQALNIEYDLSCFDTDPWEPMTGGTLSIWPFTIGRFTELPYTLTQDNTLVNILKEKTPNIWLEKVKFLKKYHGMALVNTHPDYLSDPIVWAVYVDFLKKMKEDNHYWHALPRDVARWWCYRNNTEPLDVHSGLSYREVKLINGEVCF